MDLLLNSFLFVVAVLFLYKGSDILVESAVKIAASLGISELVIGLTVVAFGTSAPEMAVSIESALAGKGDISVGNVIGSNIFNLGLILGGMALFITSKIDGPTYKRDAPLLLIVAAMIFLLAFGFHIPFVPVEGELTRWNGALLLFTLIGYLMFLYFSSKKTKEEHHESKSIALKDLSLFVLGLVVIVIGGKFLLDSSVTIARHFGLSEWFIGVTIVAVGTSAPELATSIMAAIKKKSDISLGNLIGSDLFNLLGVLGLAALISGKVSISPESSIGISMMLVSMAILFILIITRKKIDRLSGSILILVSLFRWYVNL